jgi:O-methyltransferase involved in polyketide biosynthesis
VESDLPDMIERKQRLVQHLVGDRPNLHFASVDVTTPFTISVLAADRPLTIICEGLLQYLTFAEKEQVFAHARALLQKHGGAWITPDLSTKQRRAVFRETAPEILQLLQSVDNLTGRSFSHNSFDDLEHVKRFVAEQGLNLEIMSMANVFDQLTCLDRLNINKTIAEKLLAASYVFVMTI